MSSIYGIDGNQDRLTLGHSRPHFSFNKFGYRLSSTAAGGDQVVWASTASFSVMTSADTFDIAYNNTTDGSGSTGATVLLLDYIDDSFELQQATHVLGSSGTDTTSFSGLGINRAVVVSSGSGDANGNDITISDTSATVSTQAIIPAGSSVTQQLILHLPVGVDGLIKYIKLDTNRLSGGGNPSVVFKVNVYNRLVDTAYQVRRYTLDTSITTDITEADPIGIAVSGRDVIYITMDTDTNNTEANGSFGVNVYESQ